MGTIGPVDSVEATRLHLRANYWTAHDQIIKRYLCHWKPKNNFHLAILVMGQHGDLLIVFEPASADAAITCSNWDIANESVQIYRSSDPDQILKSLHWLKVQERIEYKIISTTYKVLQSSSPHYLRDIITIQPSRSTQSSSLQGSLCFTHKLSRVSKSLTALFGMRHLTYGTNFLHLFAFLVNRPPQSALITDDCICTTFACFACK